MQSKVASGNGSASASPWVGPPMRPCGSSPASFISCDHVVHALELLLVACRGRRRWRRAATPRTRAVRHRSPCRGRGSRRARRGGRSRRSASGPRSARGLRGASATARRCPRPWLRHVNIRSARSRPAAPMRARSSASPRARRMPTASASGSPGGNEEAGLVVAADDLGHRAAGGGDERDAARHRLDRGEREALVERRHARDLGLGVELDDALGGDAATRTPPRR